jgi:hypothetical protein
MKSKGRGKSLLNSKLAQTAISFGLILQFSTKCRQIKIAGAFRCSNGKPLLSFSNFSFSKTLVLQM